MNARQDRKKMDTIKLFEYIIFRAKKKNHLKDRYTIISRLPLKIYVRVFVSCSKSIKEMAVKTERKICPKTTKVIRSSLELSTLEPFKKICMHG